ncbi:DUF3889 domain-containing protein [Lederbergia citrea]|uniref:DUF3889 domain-containing protein n=1 Tax=Lederbergia citrea TaxID=2833581 RepID=A0A942UMZ1_9BACI|nr:DUF3889 domain-containing protein [Lederbergia citrea]MBS4176495.1 DUF3889 domain-containing protein [Lederbergia citrea]MBS4203056.1 DUF3889 domain-containing protein [Lederbergia citrea]MBS4222272.1 DUF3889 domain-containing protein [Lederbergia citrea]
MKKFLLLFLTIGLFLSVGNPILTKSQQPDYVKYGRIATAVVKEDYPGEEVVDYQYVGRQKLSNTVVMDSFSFQVKENNKPVTVIVKISHSLNNKKLLNLTVEEKKA